MKNNYNNGLSFTAWLKLHDPRSVALRAQSDHRGDQLVEVPVIEEDKRCPRCSNRNGGNVALLTGNGRKCTYCNFEWLAAARDARSVFEVRCESVRVNGNRVDRTNHFDWHRGQAVAACQRTARASQSAT